MGKLVENEYTGTDSLTADQIRRALSGDYEGFKYYFENCLLLQDRDTRQYIHAKLNEGQKIMAKTIMRLVDKNTRATSHKEIIFIGPRQFGKSTLLTAISNYIIAYVPGFENLNLVTTMHQATAATKFFKQKLEPIITNVPKEIFPTIERDTLGTSTLLKYTDIKGIRRGGYYEITSAGSNSVRSGTVSVWLADEPSEYRNPEAVEDSVSGAISSYGWATFSSDYALDFTGISDFEAYMITGHEGNVVTKSKVEGTVPAGTGLLLKGDEDSYNIPVVASSSTDVSANKLVAGTGESVSAEGGKTKYVLGVSGSDEAEFQKIVSTAATVAKGKAYLQFNEEILARTMSFVGDITGVETVEAVSEAKAKEGKFIENGKLVIVKNGVKYNAAGAKLY